MSQPSHDARALVRALDALTTQLRRLADTHATPGATVHTDAMKTADDGSRVAHWRPVPLATPCAHCGHPYNWHAGWGACQLGHEDIRCGCQSFAPGEQPKPVDPQHILGAEAPTADEDQLLRWARRESLLVLITRVQHGRTLTEDEARILRQHVETEMREAETARRHAEQAEELQRIAHETSNRSEAERARAAWRAETAETELRALRAGLRANGADPTQIQNLWAQIRLRNRQWRETKQELAEAQAAIERVRALHTRTTVQTTRGPASACSGCEVDGMSAPWPCATTEALDGTEQPTTLAPQDGAAS